MLEPGLAHRAERAAREIAQMNEAADPGYAGPHALTGRRIMAAQRREGGLISATLAAAFDASERYWALANVHVPMTRTVRMLATGPFDGERQEMARSPAGNGVRVDIVVFDPLHRTVYFLEVKRGVQPIGADHMRQLETTLRALDLVGRATAEHRLGAPVRDVQPLVVSYYGATGAPASRTLPGADMDAFFGLDLQDWVEAHLRYFRFQLERLVPGLTGYTRTCPCASSGASCPAG